MAKGIDAQIRQGAANAATGQLRSIFPAPSSATLEQMATYEARLAQINRTIASGRGGVTGADATRIGAAVAQGQALQNLTPGQATLQQQIVGLGRVFDDTGKQGVNAFAGLAAGWQRLESVVTRFAIRQVLFAFVQGIKAGVQSFIDLQIKFAQIDNAARAAGSSLAAIQPSIDKLSSSSGFKQIDIANGYLQIFQQRATSGAEAATLMAQALQLARASGGTVAQSVNSLVETLNAFHLATSRATEISGLLYRTSQTGHATLEQTGAAMAQTAGTARALGISIYEVSGFIQTLGQNGETVSRSTAALEGVMRHLLSPGKDLQKVFESWGFATGQAAVSTLGFSGTLQRLFQQFQGDASRLERIAPGIRELTQAFDGSQASFDRLNSNIQSAASGQDNLAAAAARAAANVGTSLQTEFTKIQNNFINLGGGIANAINNLSSGIGGLSNVVSGGTSVILNAGYAYVAFKLAIGATNLITAAAVAASGTRAFAAEGEAAAVSKASAAYRGLRAGIAFILLLPVAIDIGKAIGNWLSQFESLTAIFRVVETISQRFLSNVAEAANHLTQIQIANAASVEHSNEDQLGRSASQLGQSLAGQRVLLQNTLRDLETRMKVIQESLRVASASIIKDLNFEIQKITKNISEAKAQINASQKFLETQRENSQARLFQAGLHVESNPTAGIGLIEGRIRNLNAEIQALGGRTDDAAIAAVRRKYDEIERLEQERFQRQTTIAEQRARTFGEGTVERFNPNTGQVERLVNLQRQYAEYTARIRRDEEARANFERQNIQRQTARQQQAQADEIAAQARRKRIEDALKSLTEFNPVDQNGRVRPEFEGATRQETQQRVRSEFERRLGELRRAAGEDEFQRILSQYGLREALTRQLSNLERQLQTNNQLQQNERAAAAVTREQRAANAAVEAAHSRLQNQSQATGQAGLRVGSDLDAVLTFINQAGLRANDPVKLGLQQDVVAINRLIAEIQLNRGTDTAAQAAERTAALQAAFAKLRDDFNAAGQANPRLAQVTNENGTVTTAQEVFDRLSQSAPAFLQAAGQLREVQNNLTTAQQAVVALSQRYVQINDELRRVPGLANAANIALNRGVDALATGIDGLTRSIRELITSMRSIPQIPGSSALQQQYNNVPPPPTPTTNRAEGGLIPGFGSGDIVPAMLEPGEFVMRRSATRQYFPLLNALNSGFTPSGASGGLSSVTTVGDITVNLQGGKPSDTSAREIAQAIRREIRRGTISQDQLLN